MAYRILILTIVVMVSPIAKEQDYGITYLILPDPYAKETAGAWMRQGNDTWKLHRRDHPVKKKTKKHIPKKSYTEYLNN